MSEQPTTRVARKVVRYMDEHPQERSPTVVAKATGATRNTAKKWMDWWDARKASGETGAQNEQNEQEQPAQSGRQLSADYPGGKPPPAPSSDGERDDEYDGFRVVF